MTIVVAAKIQPLIEGNTVFRYATVWLLERTDGVKYYFTDHNSSLDFEGNTYTPVAGMATSAEKREAGIGSRSFDAFGIIDVDKITNNDLYAGKFREAKISEWLVDWSVPWVGAIKHQVYWISEITFDAKSQAWQADVQGLSRWLTRSIGLLYNRVCRHDLGDAGCGVSLPGFTTTGEISVLKTPGDQFSIFESTLTDFGEGWFKYGKLTWTSGGNNGNINEVAGYSSDTGTFTLRLNEPFKLVTGDAFSVYAGCNKLKATCIDKFSNLPNHGGFPYIPGQDKAGETPNAH